MKHLDRKQNTQPIATNPDQPHRPPESKNTPYQRPRLINQGCLGEFIRGSSWKGVDASGQVDPDNYYPV